MFDVVSCDADNECIRRMYKIIRMYTFYLTLQKRVEKGHRELSLVWFYTGIVFTIQNVNLSDTYFLTFFK